MSTGIGPMHHQAPGRRASPGARMPGACGHCGPCKNKLSTWSTCIRRGFLAPVTCGQCGHFGPSF